VFFKPVTWYEELKQEIYLKVIVYDTKVFEFERLFQISFGPLVLKKVKMKGDCWCPEDAERCPIHYLMMIRIVSNVHSINNWIYAYYKRLVIRSYSIQVL